MARSRIAALASAACLAALALAVAPARGENAAGAWIYFDSRETADGPRLSLTGPEGTTADVAAAADTVLLSYLADRAWGALPQLSVSTDDTNRVLVRFDLPTGTTVATIAKAALSLSAHASPNPTREPLAVAVHVVTAAWDEGSTPWTAAPAFDAEPVAVLSVPPAGGPLTLDVTEAAKKAAATSERRLSLLLKARDPIGGGPAAADATLAKDLLAAVGFEPSLDAALARATSEHRPVLAVVRAGFDDAAESFPEMTLLACALVDADVLPVVRARFVPVRVRMNPSEHLAGRAQSKDALAPLGTTVKDTRPPALVVASAQGKLLGRLDAIGTHEPGLVRRFLVGVLLKSDRSKAPADAGEALAAGHDEKAAAAFATKKDDDGAYGRLRVAELAEDWAKVEALATPIAAGSGPHAAEAKIAAAVALARRGREADALRALAAVVEAAGPRRDEARYVLGCVRDAAGEAEAAKTLWQAIAKDAPTSPIGLRARARLAWPGRMRGFEAIAPSPRPAAAPTSAAGTTSTETQVARSAMPAVATRACAWLVAHRERDGSWRSPAPERSSQLGITALAARALRRWRADLPAGDRAAADRAVEKADAWLDAFARDADPAGANSFGTAYLLDYAVDRLAQDARSRPSAERAVALVLQSQCENGGFSYDKNFGTSWKGGFGGWPTTDKGRVHSMNTGLSLFALCRARDAGLAVDAKALERGCDALLAMRTKPAQFTYTFPVPRNFEASDANAARAPLCEHALLLLRAAKLADLRRATDQFLDVRGGLLDAAKLSPSWMPPHGFSSYFVLFAYHHAARAIRAAEGDGAKATLARLAEDLLAHVETDGTWVDFEESGKSYGTAAALLVLDETRR